MKIIITADEAMDKRIWEEICNLKGYNPWCVNEGLMDDDYEISLTEKEAVKLNLIERNL